MPEFPFTIGLDIDLLQVDVTASVEDHNEPPAWYNVRHHE